MGMVESILKPVKLPRMVRIRQQFDESKIEDVASVVIAELERPAISSTILPGKRICLTAGSRGVDNIALVLKTIAGFLKSKGAIPFIIPAMGSHGGAMAEGQRIVRIKDTLHLGEIWISEAMLEEAKAMPDIEILSEPASFAFDENGNLF